ncbi:HD-GYP domain-containing protein [bacterium]|nr:HD-GYP domain-containing protein [bacterium]
MSLNLSDLQMMERSAAEALLLALEARDQETFQHSARVAELCVGCAVKMGMSSDEQDDLRLAALLHDIGKIGLPDRVLHKSGKLTRNERQLVTHHPEMSVSILTPLRTLSRVSEIILQHHEKFDGTGYPRGIRAEEILIESRILALADSYDALSSMRPYRGPLRVASSVAWIKSQVGRQFCPVAALAFLDMVETAPHSNFCPPRAQVFPGEERVVPQLRTGCEI